MSKTLKDLKDLYMYKLTILLEYIYRFPISKLNICILKYPMFLESFDFKVVYLLF